MKLSKSCSDSCKLALSMLPHLVDKSLFPQTVHDLQCLRRYTLPIPPNRIHSTANLSIHTFDSFDSPISFPHSSRISPTGQQKQMPLPTLLRLHPVIRHLNTHSRSTTTPKHTLSERGVYCPGIVMDEGHFGCLPGHGLQSKG